MSKPEEIIDSAASVLAPQIAVSLRTAKLIAWGIVILLAAIVGGWIIWKLFFAERQAQAMHDQTAAKAGATVSAAQGQAGAKAANVVADSAAKETIIHERTRTNYVEITKQPGAGDPVSDAIDAAGRRAICLRFSAASLFDCQRLREANPQ